MNELSQNEQSVEAHTQVPSTDSIQKERQALLAEVGAHNTADAAKLGHLAAGHEVHADTHGNLLSPRDLEEVAHGNVAVKE